jgi:hypothetical protein
VAVIDVVFVANGVFHTHQIEADWFNAFEELTVEEESDKSEEGNEKIDRELVNRWASQLAQHAQWGMCKSNEQRGYLLEKVAGEEYEHLPVWNILSRADTLYAFEVRPIEDKRLGEQAQQLRKEGFNMNAIAQRLRISRDPVSGLLAASQPSDS